jgi:hypothetical protein
MEVKVRMSSANATTTPTISFNGLTALTIVRDGQQPLTGNDWGPSQEVTLRYDITTNNLTLMSGKLTAITPAQFDNSSKYATTNFVQRALGNFQKLLSVTGTTTLTASQSGSFVELSNSGYTVTLPSPTSSFPSVFTFYNAGITSTISITTPTGLIYTGGVGASTRTITTGVSLTFVSDGANWLVINGAGSSALVPAGYQKFTSGLIMQWTNGVSSGTSLPNLTITLPIAFPNAFLCASAVTTGGDAVASLYSATTSSLSFTAYTGSTAAITSSLGFYFIILGY